MADVKCFDAEIFNSEETMVQKMSQQFDVEKLDLNFPTLKVNK